MKTQLDEDRIRQAAQAFGLGAEIKLRRYGSGHINDTFLAETGKPEDGAFILQRINQEVFQNPKALMDNIRGVTEYLKAAVEKEGGDPGREVLNLIPDREGNSCLRDRHGDCWRMYRFVQDSFCRDLARSPEELYECGRAFGHFQRLLAGYPADQLAETIPDFHNTPKRLRGRESAARADGCGRAAGVQEELGFFMERSGRLGLALSMQQRGEIPLRVTHNDTKLNNVLLDRKTGRALCVVDLDTVMPGLSLYDFGDATRTGASTALEDERDLERVSLSLPFYTAFTKGFLEECAASLTEAEIRTLPYGAWLMTMECGIRFLTDYLSGDTYFHISRREHNLDRCRTQIRLAADMERQMEQMEAIAAETAGRVREKNPG